MKAWIFQDHRQKEKLGEKKAPWSVGWIDPEGRRKSKRVGLKSAAVKYQRKIEGQLAAGTYETVRQKTWAEFRDEYKTKMIRVMKPQSGIESGRSLDHFRRVVKPARVSAINRQTVDDFIAKRSQEDGKRKGDKISVATVNKDLRHIKAALRIAHDWGYIAKVPRFRMLKEPKKLPTYMTPEDFAKLYEACGTATMPKGLTCPAADWWRGLLTFLYMTGWRIGETLLLRREDIDLAKGYAVTRHGDNKGGRDERVKLNPVVVEHLKAVLTFEPMVFPWYHNRRSLDSEFHRIQAEAEIHLPCHERHEHTSSCHLYGFHDLRRAFATMNAGSLSADALQKLMRHSSYQTTQRYINMAEQIEDAAESLYVPPVLTIQEA